MKRKIIHWMAAAAFVVSVGGGTLTLVTPQISYAAQACSENLLTFPAWYKGLLVDAPNGNCNIKSPGAKGMGISKFIWTIALNIIQMGLNLIGYLAVGFIIYGGYKYMLSAGAPDGMVKARKTITNAVLGLILSMFSIAIVSLVSGAIK